MGESNPTVPKPELDQFFSFVTGQSERKNKKEFPKKWDTNNGISKTAKPDVRADLKQPKKPLIGVSGASDADRENPANHSEE
jgi:hypothetical protein